MPTFFDSFPSLLPFVVPAIILVILFVFTSIAFRRVVPTNMVHIVQARKSTFAYGRGKDAGNTYWAWPSWVPIIGVSVIELPESIFQVSLIDYEAYDQVRLPFMVDVTAFFRISVAEVAAQRVKNFAELQHGLQAVLQGSVRRILATNPLEEILQSRSELGDQFTKEVEKQIAEWGVLPVKTIEFMDLRDSNKGSVISNIMAKEQSRIAMESRVQVANNNRSAELAEIDAQRQIDVQRQDAAQQVGLRTAQKDREVGIATEQSRQAVLASAKETTQRQMDVNQVESVRTAEIARDVAVVAAGQTQQVVVIEAEGHKQARVVEAEGDLAAAKLHADGTRAEGEAKAAAEQALLLAPVNSQITLAREIGNNQGYQQYLITIKQVEAGQAVGMELARALQAADLKVIANSGDVQQGVASLGDLFTPAGGTKLSGMLTALGQTPEGKALLDSLMANPEKLKSLGVGATVAGATGNATAGAVAAMAAGQGVAHANTANATSTSWNQPHGGSQWKQGQ